MPTSDVFKKKNNQEEADTYAIVGSGGINFTFSSKLYDKQTVEAIAIDRAKSLHCSLFRKDQFGKIYQVYPETGRVVKTDNPINRKAYPEMMSNDPFVPGIQIQSY